MNLNTCTYLVQPKTRTLKTRTLYSLKKATGPYNSKLNIYLRHYFKFFLKTYAVISKNQPILIYAYIVSICNLSKQYVKLISRC